jgi:hypothetical protein
VTDFRSWPKKWNDASLSDFVAMPEFKRSGTQWSMFGMLAIGLVAGAAIGGYAVSQRDEMRRLAKRARRMGEELSAMSDVDVVKPATRSNHRRKATSEV